MAGERGRIGGICYHIGEVGLRKGQDRRSMLSHRRGWLEKGTGEVEYVITGEVGCKKWQNRRNMLSHRRG